jgi:hypothetical protein
MEPRSESASGKKPRRDAGPHQLVGMVYDLAILACGRRDDARAKKAIGLLRDVMRSAGPADSSDLMSFYDWCLERIRLGEFDLAAQALADLRQAWENAGP